MVSNMMMIGTVNDMQIVSRSVACAPCTQMSDRAA